MRNVSREKGNGIALTLEHHCISAGLRDFRGGWMAGCVVRVRSVVGHSGQDLWGYEGANLSDVCISANQEPET